jgi:hypothetical protein
LPRWHPLSGSPSRAIPLLLRARPDAGEGTCRCFCRERQDLGKPHGTPSQAVARHLLPTMRRSRHQQDIGASQTVVLSGLWARILLPPNENARHRGEESAGEVAAGAPGLLASKGGPRDACGHGVKGGPRRRARAAQPRLHALDAKRSCPSRRRETFVRASRKLAAALFAAVMALATLQKRKTRLGCRARNPGRVFGQDANLSGRASCRGVPTPAVSVKIILPLPFAIHVRRQTPARARASRRREVSGGWRERRWNAPRVPDDVR